MDFFRRAILVSSERRLRPPLGVLTSNPPRIFLRKMLSHIFLTLEFSWIHRKEEIGPDGFLSAGDSRPVGKAVRGRIWPLTSSRFASRSPAPHFEDPLDLLRDSAAIRNTRRCVVQV